MVRKLRPFGLILLKIAAVAVVVFLTWKLFIAVFGCFAAIFGASFFVNQKLRKRVRCATGKILVGAYEVLSDIMSLIFTGEIPKKKKAKKNKDDDDDD